MSGARKKGTFSSLLGDLRSQRVWIVLSCLLAAVSVIASLFIPLQIGRAVDVIRAGAGGVDLPALSRIAGIIGICIALAAIAQWCLGLVNNRISYRVSASYRERCFAHLQQLPLATIDRQGFGDTISRVVTDVEQVSDGLLLAFTQLFSGILTIAVTLFFMVRINVWIALFVAVVSPLSFLLAKFIADRSYRYFTAQSALRGELTSCTEEMIGHAKVVKAFGHERAAQEQFDEINGRLDSASKKAIFYSSLTNPSTRFMYSIIYAGVAIAGCLLCLPTHGAAMTVGKLTSFLTYTNQYTKPFNEITGLVTEFQNAMASADRIFALLAEELEEPDATDAAVLSDVHGDVEIEQVNFSYENGKPILQDVTVSAKAGERVAIIGPTGGGKTTLINLLMRFYDVDAGSIRVDGVDIRNVTRASLRENIGMVLQDTWLPTGSVREIISYGRPDATEDEVMEAAKAAHAHGFITRLPQGYDTPIGEDGGNLSAGQKQLLCIARVMLRRPPMLILDEATSSIDTMTEQRVQRAFLAMMEGRTSFVVAHRLSTIRGSDQTLVMRDGKLDHGDGSFG